MQGLAAVTMPSCQSHGQKMEMQVDVDHSESMSHFNHHQDGNQPSKNAPCDKCSSCNLSASQAIIPSNLFVEVFGVASAVASLATEAPDSVHSSLFRPPRLTFAQC
jgi:hypothetical protein